MTEYEVEVCFEEDFSKWSDEQKNKLIETIKNGGKWEFITETSVHVEPEFEI